MANVSVIFQRSATQKLTLLPVKSLELVPFSADDDGLGISTSLLDTLADCKVGLDCG